MSIQVAFLRAINLGAKRKFGKADLRACLAQAGYTDIDTYLNTGNVRLRSAESLEDDEFAERLETLFAADRGFEVPTVVMGLAELAQIRADGQALAESFDDVGQHYVSLLKHPPDPEAVAELEAMTIPGERVTIHGRGCHLLLARRDSYHNSKLGNAHVEPRLGVATNRTFRVISTLVDKWAAPNLTM